MQNGLLLYGRGRYIALNLSAGQVSGLSAVARLLVSGFTAAVRISGAITVVKRLAVTASLSTNTATASVERRLSGSFSTKPD